MGFNLVLDVPLLKSYNSTGGLHYQQPPKPISVAGQQEFEVAHILLQWKWGRGLQYLVEYTGYDLDDAMWERRRHLAHA